MKFPESERVIYKKNPLIEVVCQFQYPPILKISQQLPADFQDRVREEYPIFKKQNSQLPSEISNIIRQFDDSFIDNQDQVYIFQSEDSIWQIVLDQNSITLSTRKYERYEEFRQKFKGVVNVFEEIYRPSFYSRLGLRYRDLIVRSQLDLIGVSWSELIPRQLASELHSQEMAESITGFMKNLQMSSESTQIALSHGLVMARNSENNENEESYLIDSDFSTTNKTSRNDEAWDTIDIFNKTARNLFRWSITDKLHNALIPVGVDN
jgi:uncharacterized protein (TIGR04255 family)